MDITGIQYLVKEEIAA